MKMKSIVMLAAAGLMTGSLGLSVPAFADDVSAANIQPNQMVADNGSGSTQDQNSGSMDNSNSTSGTDTSTGTGSDGSGNNNDSGTPDTASGEDDY